MDTVELCYEEFGKDNPLPLVILHGFFASSRNWRRIAEGLSPSFHVYVPDLRNHGNSPHHPDMDYPSMAGDVLRFMAEREIAKAHILGHSMGGKIAMWLALNHPECFRKLIIADIAPKAYGHRFDDLIDALMGLPVNQIQSRKEADNWLSKDIPDQGHRQFLLQNLAATESGYHWRIDLDIFRRQAFHIAGFPETRSGQINHGEALFLTGSRSSFVSRDDVVGLFPNAQFKEIANAGHWLHVDNTDKFLLEVEKYLLNRP